MKKQDAVRILFAELGKRRRLEEQEDRQPIDETTEALQTLLEEVGK